MYSSFERLWVSFQDSDRFRHFVKHGEGARLFRSPAYQKAYLAKNYLRSLVTAQRNAALTKNIETVCLFVGHNKSGTSMLGALLDAHLEVVLADEVDALNYVNNGFRQNQIFQILIRASRREMLKGRVTARRLGGYSWLVPGQWQGDFKNIKVIGDSTSGSSTRRVGEDPQLLPKLRQTMAGKKVKFILVIRNPFDPISLIMIRGKRTFENALEHYFSNCAIVEQLCCQLSEDEILPVHYEAFIEQPQRQLTKICHFLGLTAEQSYLEACSSILHSTPKQDRHLILWERAQIELVEERIRQFEFLHGYSFAS